VYEVLFPDTLVVHASGARLLLVWLKVIVIVSLGFRAGKEIFEVSATKPSLVTTGVSATAEPSRVIVLTA
jgi:hypothetical protein